MKFDFALEPGKKLLNRGLVKNGKPMVSIITPYYNAGRYFEQTYNCVLNQTFPFFEWVIVNDGSTEKKDVELLERFAGSDRRIRVLHKENGGLSSARNHAIRNAETEILITLDPDDIIEPTYIEELYWALIYNPETAWSYTNSVGFQNQEYVWNKYFDPKLLCTENFMVSSAAFRKSDLLEVGLYDEIARYYYEDWLLWLKLLSVGKKPVKVASYGFWYRRTDTGDSFVISQDTEKTKFSERVIKESAKTVDTTVTAIEYPHAESGNRYDIPKTSGWDKPFFEKNDKLHVLMILPWTVFGGADKLNLDIVRGLDKRRFDVGLITTLPSDNAWGQLFREHCADVFNLPDFLDMNNWAEFISYYIKSRNVNVVFLSNSDYGYSLLPWLRREFPGLAIIDYVHMTEWYWRNGGFARMSAQMGELLDKTFVCNNLTRNDMVGIFGRTPESVETLYIGVHHDIFDPAKTETGFIHRTFGLASSRPAVLFPCRIHPQKRPFLMLEIASELKKSVKDVVFVVVGDGPQLDELKMKTEQCGLAETVLFAGRQDDMLPYYRDSNATLICSIKEGLALTAYESLSMGVPVVSADVGGQAELIDGKVGAIVPLMQDETLDLDSRDFVTEEISLYAEDLREILTNKEKYLNIHDECRRRIISGFSTEIMLNKLQNYLQEIVNDGDALKRRIQTSEKIKQLGNVAEVVATLYTELQIRDTAVASAIENIAEAVIPTNTDGAGGGNPQFKNELLRIANSRMGRGMLKIMFKLRLNKLFK